MMIYDQRFTSPFIVTGEARTRWFHEGSTQAELRQSDGTILWQGLIHVVEGFDIYDQILPFKTTTVVDLGDYTGPATLVIYEPSEDEELTGRAVFSQTIEIVK